MRPGYDAGAAIAHQSRSVKEETLKLDQSVVSDGPWRHSDARTPASANLRR